MNTYNIGERKIDVRKAFILRQQGLSYPKIAKVMGCSPSAVHKALRPFVSNQTVADVREQAGEIIGDICEQKMLECIAAVDGDKIKGMGGRDLIVSAGILFDKMRLARGQSTGNLAVSILSGVPDPGHAIVNSTLTPSANTLDLQDDSGCAPE